MMNIIIYLLFIILSLYCSIISCDSSNVEIDSFGDTIVSNTNNDINKNLPIYESEEIEEIAIDPIVSNINNDINEQLTDYELEEIDEIIDPVVGYNDEREVGFYNSYKNITLSLFWSKDGNSAYITQINPKKTIAVNTFNGHAFYATEQQYGNKRTTPHVITIQPNKHLYIFGPAEDMEVRDRLHPAVTLLNQHSSAMSAKFVCLASGCDIYYDDGKDGLFHGRLDIMKETTTMSYEGHKFFFTKKEKKDVILGSHVMKKDQYIYEIEDPKFPPLVPHLEFMYKQKKFNEIYRNKTGLLWRSFYGDKGPRPPPSLFMWPAEQVGQVHRINSSESFWTCDGPASECQSKEELHFELEVISTHPKAFVIPNFLSDFEADMIIQLAQPKLDGSLVGDREAGGGRSSETRTSRNAWVPRHTNKQTETLFKRAAQLLQIDEKLLTSSANAEDMQVVSYRDKQKYDAHHDWGVRGKPESRYITLLLYLNDKASPKAGGETSFPLAAGGRGIKVHPGKGSAVLFYNLLEDGNADELTLHAATPVYEGIKWLANFWVWDPKK